jgi:hypothetical protein
MRLLKSVTNAAGVVVLEAGATLTDPLITRLLNAGIKVFL